MIETIVAAKTQFESTDLFVFDRSSPVGAQAIYWRPSPTHPRAAPAEASLRAADHRERTIRILDQHWGVVFLPEPGTPGPLWSLPVLMPPAVGLLLTALAVAYLRLSRRRTEQLLALAVRLRRTTSQLRVAGRKVAHLARHDALTGLPNRRLFTERLELAVTRVAVEARACAVLLLDLDGFKAVNDLHGHAAGDVVLCEVASRLRSVLRTQITVARLGGDEFAAIVECDSPAGRSAMLARGIIEAVSRPIALGSLSVEVGASVGIALCPVHGVEPKALMRAADVAMYRAKHRGRGTFCVFEHGMEDSHATAALIAAEADRRAA